MEKSQMDYELKKIKMSQMVSRLLLNSNMVNTSIFQSRLFFWRSYREKRKFSLDGVLYRSIAFTETLINIAILFI